MLILKNQKIVVKIVSILSVLLLLILGVGGTGLFAAQKLTNILQSMYYERLHPIELLDNVRLISKDSESKLLELIQMEDVAQQQAMIQKINQNTAEINRLQQEYSEIHLDEFAVDKAKELDVALVAYRKSRNDIIQLATNGRQKEAFALYESSKPVFAKALTLRAEISEHNSQVGKELNEIGSLTARQSMLFIIIVTAAAFVFAGVLGWLLAKSISWPIHRILAAINEIANGNLSESARTVVSKDELGQLADATAKMRHDLRNLIENINESGGQAAAASEELSATSHEASVTAAHVAKASVEIAEKTSLQVEAVNHSKSGIENMSDSVKEVAVSTSSVSAVADQTSTVASNGLDTINQVIRQIGNIEKTVLDAAKIIATLGTRSNDIGQIVETISMIAGQTNLLALNAAIEAARAGEQGRGFSVVADEVRKLAEQSDSAANQIGTLIKAIQEDTVKAVDSMKVGTEEVKLGTEVVNNAGQAFKEIVKSINMLSQQIKEISQEVQLMAGNSQNVVAAITNIDTATKSTAANTQSISASAEEQSAAMEEIESASSSLAKLAETLQQSIHGFKL